MTISNKHKFVSAKSDVADTSLVRPSNWNDEHDLTMAADRLIGRTTAGPGAAEEISVGTGLTLASGTLSVTTNTYQPLDTELTALAGLVSAADAAPYFTGSGTAALMTVTAAARTILDDTTTAAIATTLGLGTASNPQFATVELGAATDTTISRVSAGVIAVEGKNVALNGTGETLTTGTVELGHATDTTISRVSAGVVAVEGKNVALNGTGETFTTGTIELGAASDTTLSRSAAGVLAVEGINALLAGKTDTITKGFTVTPNNIGTVSSGTTTPSAANGNYQYYTNNGAHILAAPAADCAIDILITNGATAGAITFSGFTVGASTGSTYNTTNTNKFILSIRRINAVATYSWYALQ